MQQGNWPDLSIDDVTVDEDAGSAAFTVSMSRASAEIVTVAYATSNGLARADSDYTAVRGTLTLSPGDRTGSIPVTVLDDDVPEHEEAFLVTLSAPVGAIVADGEGVGTILDDDLDDTARANGRAAVGWLRSFGGVSSSHVVDAVDERMRCARHRRFEEGPPGPLPLRWRCEPRYQGTSSLVVNGRRLLGGGLRTDNTVPRHLNARTYHRWSEYDETRLDRSWYAHRSLTAAESLAGSSFQLAPGTHDAASTIYLWGRGSFSRLDGRDGPLVFDGDVRSATVGVELASDRVLSGIAFSHSLGTGSLREGDDAGASESSLSGVYPYAHYSVNERLTVWGTLGYGSGSLDLSMGEADSIRTGLAMTMGAAGARSTILPATRERNLSLAVDADALFTGIDFDAASRLMAGQARGRRLRVGLEGSYLIVTEGAELAPYAEVGLRHDGGDGETGLGVEIGGGMRYAHPVLDLTMEFDVHGLLAHEVDGAAEWGASGSIRYDPFSNSDQGPSLRLSSSWGAQDARGLDALWQRESAIGSLVDDRDDLRASIDAELGYGFPLPSGSGTGTPWVGVSLNDQRRDLRLGYRLEIGPSVHVGIEGLIREGVRDGEPSDHAVMLQLSLQ